MNDLIERFSIRCARGNNGGEWATHYTEEQKEFWRRFVRDLISAVTRPHPIDTAPRDGREIWLVAIMPQEDDTFRIISISNGYWSGKEHRIHDHVETRGFTLGQPGYDVNVDDGCATHWLPREAIDVDGLFVPPSRTPRLPELPA